jgi:hypothetical protein
MAWRWSELMGRETTSNSGGLGGAAQLLADQCRRTWGSTGRAVEHAPQRSHGKLGTELEPGM